MSEPAFWVARCNAEDAAAAWPKALPLLAPAIAQQGGLFEPEDVLERVTRPAAGSVAPQSWALWLVAEKGELLGAWVTAIREYPRDLVVETVFGGGTRLAEWFEFTLAEMDKFAALVGTTRLHCGGRRGWARIGGYRQVGYLHERRIAA